MNDQILIVVFFLVFFGLIWAGLVAIFLINMYHHWREYQERRRETRETGKRFYT